MKKLLALALMLVSFSAVAQSEQFVDPNRAKRFFCNYRKDFAQYLIGQAARGHSKAVFVINNPMPADWSPAQKKIMGTIVDDAFEYKGDPRVFGKNVFDACMKE